MTFKKGRGRLSKEAIALIVKNLDKTDEWLAERLGKTVIAISNARKQILAKERSVSIIESKSQEDINLLSRLHHLSVWLDIKARYSSDELRLVEFNWIELSRQFQEDMTHTEQLQIFKLIDIEVMLDRNMKDRNRNGEEIRFLEDVLDEEASKDKDDRDLDKINETMKQINQLRANHGQNTSQYKDLVDRHQKILTDLKGTRTQRIKEVESSNQNFFNWMKALHNSEYRRKLSNEIELMRIAADTERERLSKYHTYMDNEVGQPFLTPDTILDDNIL